MDNIPEVNLDTLKDENMCFGCGEANPIGLKLKFNWDEKSQTVQSEFTPNANLQGWSGFVHGGITACILDEAIGWAAVYCGTNNVTAKLQVRYRRMIPVGQSLTVSCTVTKKTSRLIETEAKITDKAGNVMAEATSTQFIISKREDDSKKNE